GGEVVRFCPAQSQPDPDLADLGVLVHTAGVTGDVQAGDAKPAPTRVTFMMSFSTVAGASSAPSPCPRASNPTASTAASTSGSPTISAIMSGRSAPLERFTVSHPKLSAWRS